MKWWLPIFVGLVATLSVAGSVQLFITSHVYTPPQRYPQRLRAPRILEKRDRNMLVVRSADPEADRRRASRFLLNAAQVLRLTDQVFVRPSRVRRRGDRFGVEAPDKLEKLSRPIETGSWSLAIERWDYGPCAEILHVGPYDTVEKAQAQLDSFIRSQGYERIDGFEEEYVLTRNLVRGRKAQQTIVRARIRPR